MACRGARTWSGGAPRPSGFCAIRFLDLCHARLETFRDSGTTLILVSHAPQTVLQYCRRCIWLERGVMKADGDAAEVLEQYGEAMHAAQPMVQPVPAPIPEAVPVAAGD